MLELPEAEVDEAARDAEVPRHVAWRDRRAVVFVDERERAVDKPRGRGERFRRCALDEAYVGKRMVVDLYSVSEQRLQLHRGAESLFLEVGFDAGKARGEAGAEAGVIVDP